jgi:transposase
VRGHENLLKRLLVHASAFNLGLWMRRLFGIGTPRALQGRAVALLVGLRLLWALIYEEIAAIWTQSDRPVPVQCPVITVDACA